MLSRGKFTTNPYFFFHHFVSVLLVRFCTTMKPAFHFRGYVFYKHSPFFGSAAGNLRTDTQWFRAAKNWDESPVSLAGPFVRSHRSLICWLRTSCFARTLCRARSLPHSRARGKVNDSTWFWPTVRQDTVEITETSGNFSCMSVFRHQTRLADLLQSLQ